MKKTFLIIGLALLLAPIVVFAGARRQPTTAERTPASFLTPAGRLPLVSQPYTISLGCSRDAAVTDYYDNYYTKWVQDKTGLTLQFEFFAPGDDGQMQFELMVSSGQKLPDILAMTLPNWREHGENGVFIDLNPYYERYAFFYNQMMDKLKAQNGDDRERDRIKIKTSSYTGKRFAFPSYNESQSDQQLNTTMINTTWLNNLGLRMPTTTQELRDVLTAFRDRDPNRNGRNDEIPMLGPMSDWHADPINWLINAFVYWGAGTNVGTLNVTNGRLWVPYTTDEYRDALRYIRGLVADRLLSEMSFSLSREEMIPLLNPADGVFTVGISTGHPILVWRTNSAAVDNYRFMPSVTGPRGVNWAPVDMPIVQNGPFSYITKEAQYPDVAFRLLDFFASEDSSMISRWGQEGVDWVWSETGSASVYGKRFETPNTLWGATSQKQQWKQVVGYFQLDVHSVFRDDGSWSSKRDMVFQDYVTNNAGKQPREIVDEVVMTQEELNSIREVIASIESYVKEQQALFCTGRRDVERDWNDYLNQLNRIGLQRYLEVVQRAYTRTISN
jgi:putative aldouronate transport system substrate-binding protein